MNHNNNNNNNDDDDNNNDNNYSTKKFTKLIITISMRKRHPNPARARVCGVSEYYVCIPCVCVYVLCMCCSAGIHKCNPLAVIMSQRKINRKYRKTAIEREMKTASPRRVHYPFPDHFFLRPAMRHNYITPFSSRAFLFQTFSCSSLPPVFCRTESVGCGPAPGARRPYAVSCTHSPADNRHANLLTS